MNPPLFYWQQIDTPVHHHIRTLSVHDDLLGWVVAGEKKVFTPHQASTAMVFKAGEMFILARGTQWDIINTPQAHRRYQAQMLALTPTLVDQFHQHFPQFASSGVVKAGLKVPHTPTLQAVVQHVLHGVALESSRVSAALQHHRVMELLLTLAEAGYVLARPSALSWLEQVRRRVAQRPHANWSVEELAASFHTSSSTLRRRLAAEGQSLALCVREVRLETALTLLQTTRLPVADIAARCGYGSHSRFSAAFRDRFGFVPSHLRPVSSA